jgi:pantetheine-phosphate adenylyltransferase
MRVMTQIALFPGVFDPPTLGHLDIIKRASLVCEKLIVGVAQNLTKTSLFTIEERIAMLRAATHANPHVEIAAFSELAVEFAKKRKVHFLLRGLRSFADFEHESQMAAANRRMSGLETIFFMAQHPQISSSLIREIAHFGGPLEDLIPAEAEPIVRKKFTPHK